MPDSTAHHELIRTLRHALRHLYDPIHTANSELISLLGLAEADLPAMDLQTLLTNAIESLRPDVSVSPDSCQWSHYHLLSQRYVEQFSPDDVAVNLSVSPRTYRRLHSQALEALANQILADRGGSPEAATRSERGSGEVESALAQELTWLRSTTQPESVDVLAMVGSVIEVVAPMLEQVQTSVQWAKPARLPLATARPVALQHALTSLFTAMAETASGGTLRVSTTTSGSRLIVSFEPVPDAGAARHVHVVAPEDEEISMVSELVHVAGGQLSAMPDEASTVHSVAVVLYVAERTPVLVIDDNADTLRLYERFLAGGRYRFEGVQSPVEALSLVPQISPVVIILDLMVPGMDGWTVLRNLKASDHGRDIPVIVSSILPQEHLALTLGASAFLRKPVSQDALLEVLEGVCRPRA